jgi:hypothetical protein
MKTISDSLARLSDTELVSEVKRLAKTEAHAIAHLVASLAVLDARRSYLEEGYSSTFGFCVQSLGLSESAAFYRIKAARAARRFPVILERLASGTLTLKAVRMLKPHLTKENHLELLDAAAGKTRREIELIVAALDPKPDVPATVRKLPARRAATVPAPVDVEHQNAAAVLRSSFPPVGTSAAMSVARAGAPAVEPLHGSADGIREAPVSIEAVGPRSTTLAQSSTLGSAVSQPAPAITSPPCRRVAAPACESASAASEPLTAATFLLSRQKIPPVVTEARHRAVVEPLAPERYKVQMTISSETHAKLRRAQDLLRHQIPTGDLVVVFDRALTLLVTELEQKKIAAVSRPRSSKADAGSSNPASSEAAKPQSRQKKRGRGKPTTTKLDNQQVPATARLPEAVSADRRLEDAKDKDRPVGENGTGRPVGWTGNGKRVDRVNGSDQAGDGCDDRSELFRTGEAPRGGSRYISADVRRRVWNRDGGALQIRWELRASMR